LTEKIWNRGQVSRIWNSLLSQLARRYPFAALPWSLAPPGACASYPSCVAVYPRDSRSRRVLSRCSQQLLWNSLLSWFARRYLSRLYLLSRCSHQLDSRM